MGYNPNEERDLRGRWTTGGVGYSDAHAHPAGPYMDIKDPAQAEHADHVAKIAADVATKLGYDPSGINVVDDKHPFELNGKTLYAAGLATRPPEPKLVTDPDGSKHITGEKNVGPITLFTPTIGNDPKGIAGVVAHEVTHQKFNALLNDKVSDYLKMTQDPDYMKTDKWVPDPGGTTMPHATDYDSNPIKRELGFIRPDGLLNEPYASKYPAYQAWAKATMPSVADMAKSDGVSDYSKEYWLGTHQSVEKNDMVVGGKPQTYTTSAIEPLTAFHETLAEIGRLKYSGEPVYHKKLGEVDGKPVYFSQGKEGVNPKWRALYTAMDKNWKRRNSK